MKGLMAVGAVFVLAGRLLAQQQEDPVERDVQRLKDRLNLTDDQVTKVRDVVKKEHEDLKALLTDDQKKTYDQGGRGAPGGRGGTQGNTTGTRSAWYPSTDELKKDLSLTDDQVTKVNAVRDGVREEMRRMFQNRRGGGGQDFQATMDKLRDETTQKMRDVLTDEQKPKFDEVIKTYRAQQDPGGRGAFGRGGPGGTGGGTIDERVKAVMDALKIEKAEEADAVKGLVKKVLELMDKQGAFQRDARTKIDEAARNKELSDKAIGDQIEEILKGQSEIEKDLKGARKDLADVVTNRQELELLRRGILR